MDTTDYEITPEVLEYYERVKEHNRVVHPILKRFMEKCSLIHPQVYDMGSRGFTWKYPTNYIRSDFEIAVVAPIEDHENLIKLFQDMLEKEGYSVKEFRTKAGLVFQVIKDYDFGDGFIEKLEICYQTPEQNQAIKDAYLKHVPLGRFPNGKIPWYVWTMNKASKEDPELYLKMKGWLKVLDEKKE